MGWSVPHQATALLKSTLWSVYSLMASLYPNHFRVSAFSSPFLGLCPVPPRLSSLKGGASGLPVPSVRACGLVLRLVG